MTIRAGAIAVTIAACAASSASAAPWKPGHPKDAAQAYKLDASAAGGALDVLGNFNIGTNSAALTSYRLILPGLTLKARPQRLLRGERTEVRFTVLDAGAPVKGAKVKVGGESGTSDRRVA